MVHCAGERPLYQVLEQQAAPVGNALMGSDHTYVIPGAGAAAGGGAKGAAAAAAKRCAAPSIVTTLPTECISSLWRLNSMSIPTQRQARRSVQL